MSLSVFAGLKRLDAATSENVNGPLYAGIKLSRDRSRRQPLAGRLPQIGRGYAPNP
jgi:hypothetical protein